MNLFFVYKEHDAPNIYIDRLSRLHYAQIIAAFPSRKKAVDFALSIDNGSVVVVERIFSLQNGDENNLISECEWKNIKETVIEPEPIPEPEPVPKLPLTGTIEIDGNLQVGEKLTINVSDLGGSGKINYQWAIADNPNSVGKIIPDAVDAEYFLNEDAENKYIIAAVSREENYGYVFSEAVGPVIGA